MADKFFMGVTMLAGILFPVAAIELAERAETIKRQGAARLQEQATITQLTQEVNTLRGLLGHVENENLRLRHSNCDWTRAAMAGAVTAVSLAVIQQLR